MVNALMVFELMPSRRQYPDNASWEGAFDRFYDAELGRTYGNLLKRVAEIPGFPSELLGRLSAAKTDRDHLAHRFFREHDSDFASSEGRTRMIAECEELIERFGQLDRELDEFSEPQRLKFGMTQEWIDQKADELMAYAILRERSVSEERPSDDGNSATSNAGL
jgi:hypothetical protein